MAWKNKQEERPNSFSFYYSYYDVAKDMTGKQRLEFYDAVMAFIFDDDDREERLTKFVKVAFKGIKANLVTSKLRSISGGIKTKSNGNQNENKTETISMSMSMSKPKAKRHQTNCPKCGGKLWRNTQTGKLECDTCLESFIAGDVA